MRLKKQKAAARFVGCFDMAPHQMGACLVHLSTWAPAFLGVPLKQHQTQKRAHSVDGRNPAPQRRWKDDFPANTDKQWFPRWCRISSIHSSVMQSKRQRSSYQMGVSQNVWTLLWRVFCFPFIPNEGPLKRSRPSIFQGKRSESWKPFLGATSEGCLWTPESRFNHRAMNLFLRLL